MNSVYPIFYKMTFFIKDYFWKGIMYRLSKNLFDVSCENKCNNVYVNVAGRDFIFDKHLTRTQPKILEFLDVLELYIRDTQFSKNFVKYEYDSWLDIKKKAIKKYLIEIYLVEAYKSRYPPATLLKIVNKVNMNIIFKNIIAKDITYSAGRILHINGIDDIVRSMTCEQCSNTLP